MARDQWHRALMIWVEQVKVGIRCSGPAPPVIGEKLPVDLEGDFNEMPGARHVRAL